MKRLALAASLLAVVAIISGSSAKADVNDFVVTSFSSDQTLSRRDKQGELRIREEIEVAFTDQNHGIERAIPNSYKNHSLQIAIHKVGSGSGAPAQYTTYESNGNTVLRIGDPDRTVTGRQQYTIEYTVQNVITFYEGHDELYWDVNGDQWRQPFTKISLKLHTPADLQKTKAPLFFAGKHKDCVRNICAVSISENTIEVTTTEPLPAGQTLTYVAGFEKGYFQPATAMETVGEHWKQIAGFVLPILILGGGSALYWWRKGRDAPGSGILVPQYEAPDGLKPMAVGALVDFKVDNRDITATIIDLAVRGYLKIVETKKVKFIGKDKLTYKLQLENADFSSLDSNERLLMQALFSSAQKTGAEIDISASQNKLYAAAASLKKSVKDFLKEDGYLRKGSLSAATTIRGLLLVAAIIAGGFVLFVFSEGTSVFGCIVGILIAVPFWLAMNARTPRGVAAKEHILGLKMYLEVAEKDRLQKTQGPDARYAANAETPVKTVELFEKLLPYAVVLGVEKQWASQFEDLYNTPPEWYGGNLNTFSTFYLASSLSDGVGSAVNSAFSAPSSSSGSGFSSGGGSSGGGGGGGGGGGW